jgi:hypothetical protein
MHVYKLPNNKLIDKEEKKIRCYNIWNSRLSDTELKRPLDDKNVTHEKLKQNYFLVYLNNKKSSSFI